MFPILPLAACVPGGVSEPDGTINLGPSVFGDDPIGHKGGYPDYPTYLVNEEYIGDNLKRLSKDQQICVLRAGFVQLPQDLQTQFNDFAAGKTTLMESEYMALQRRAERYYNDHDVARAAKSYMTSNCGIDPG